MITYFVIAILMLVVGIVIAAFGVIASADPEGRGAKYAWMFYVGAIVVVLAIIWLLILIWEAVRSVL